MKRYVYFFIAMAIILFYERLAEIFGHNDSKPGTLLVPPITGIRRFTAFYATGE